jgi:hypothetical protein
MDGGTPGLKSAIVSFVAVVELVVVVVVLQDHRIQPTVTNVLVYLWQNRKGIHTIGRPSVTPPTVLRRGEVMPPTIGRPFVVSSTVLRRPPSKPPPPPLLLLPPPPRSPAMMIMSW